MKRQLLFTSIFLLGTFVSNAQWEPDVRLTNDPATSWTLSKEAVAASGDTVHVVWRDFREVRHSEIYYKRSIDGGVNWGADNRLTFKSQVIINGGVYQESFYPTVAVSGSVVHVVWHDERDGNYEIYYKRSTDGGASWGPDLRITNDPAYSEAASVAVSGSTVYIVWEDNQDGNYAIYGKRSTNEGASWEGNTRLSTSTGDSDSPSVSISGLNVDVAWHDNRDGNSEIYYKHSADGGVTWGADLRLTNNSFESFSPSVSATGTTVNVVWEDNRDGNYAIYYKRSSDTGISWGTETLLTSTGKSIDSHDASVAATGKIVYVVWFDMRNVNWEIYYKRSTDGGISWEADTRLTNNSASSLYPSIALSGKALHVVWQEHRDGNDEIYYKRNPTSTVVGIKDLQSAGSQFTFFPNPASTEIKVKSLENINEFTITDIYGKEIYHSGILNPSPEILIPVYGFPAGIYFIQLKNETGKSVQKFIKL
jgi:hypothetical protein